MTSLACVMGWATSLLYLAPVLVMVGLVGFVHMKAKLQVKREGGASAAREPRLTV